jgi:hypothetical protein
MTTAERLATILGWLMLSITALSQTTNSGNVVSVGQVNHGGGGGGGAPLTYSARTDLCVTGSEAGCSGKGLAFQMRPTDSVPFASYPGAPVNASATDPDFHSYLVIATDWNTGAQNNSWMVNNGEQATFNMDSTMIHIVQNGSADRILLLDPAAIHAHASPCAGCVAETPIISGPVELGCGNNCINIDSGSIAIFSVVPGENNILYELAANSVLVNQLAIQTAGTPAHNCSMATPGSCTFSRTPYVDYTSDSPVPCSAWGAQSSTVHVTWNGVVNAAFDGSFSLALDGGPDWQANTAYVSPDDIIFPQVNNGTKTRGFQATVSGTSGGTEPNWNTTCATAGQTCTDGGVTWKNIGRITGQGYALNIVAYDKNRGCSRLNTLTGKVYRGTNQGSNYPSAGTPDPSGDWTTDDDFVCERYGVSYPGTCPLPDRIALHEGGSFPDSRYVQLGTANPAIAGRCNGNGSFPPTGQCSCLQASANYRHGWSATTDYTSGTKDTVFDPTGNPPSLYTANANSGPSYGGAQPPSSSPTYWGLSDVACYSYYWETRTTNLRPCMAAGNIGGGQCDGHGVKGYLNDYSGTGAGGLVPHLYSRPSISGQANPGTPTTVPSQGLPAQHHGSYLNSGTVDQAPIGLIQTAVPTSTYALGAANSPWYAELAAVAVDGSHTMYRFAHVFNTGSEPNFNAQNNVGAISEDGQFMAVTTDMMGTRGSFAPDWQSAQSYALGATMFPTSGNAGNYDFQVTVVTTGMTGATEPTWCQTSGCTVTDGGVTWTNLGASCNQLRAMYDPTASKAFSVGDTVYPSSNNVVANLYQATQAGTSYSTLPSWTALAPNWGDTLCDDAAHELNQACPAGVIQWTNVGPNDCRFDVVIVDLLSAH